MACYVEVYKDMTFAHIYYFINIIAFIELYSYGDTIYAANYTN